MQAHGAVNIGHAEQAEPLVDDAFDRLVRFFELCDGGVRRLCAHIGGAAAVARFVPVSLFARQVKHVAAVDLPERGVRSSRASADVEPVRVHEHIFRVQGDVGNVRLGFGLFRRLLGRFGGVGLPAFVGERLLGEFGKLRILIGQDDRRVVVFVCISAARRHHGQGAQKKRQRACHGCKKVFLHR